ncbi:hypothetical protein AAFC00_006150 [Neodothiora populina]|uniref:Uncharacterized protein n=1 Tax=Neodothiora populina TaxID=2781224 RepID=A0ABR3P4J6_9PEZI
MTLKDLLHKHKQLQETATATTASSSANHPARGSTDDTTRPSSDKSSAGPDLRPRSFDVDNTIPIPEFTFLRTTTHDEEVIKPPHYPEDDHDHAKGAKSTLVEKSPEKQKKRRSLFRSRSGTLPSRSPSTQSLNSVKSENGIHTDANVPPPLPPQGSDVLVTPTRPEAKRKLSERLHLSKSPAHTRPEELSPNLPNDLGDAPEPAPAPSEGPDARGKVKEYETKQVRARREDLWERRACKLAAHLHVPTAGPWGMSGTPERKKRGSFIDEKEEVNIQQAIILHESGELDRSTAIFGRLADPRGANNPLSQVLYGLALRHGWGVEPSAETAVLYLSLAARTSAQIQQMSSTGGEARGELILAMFELGNCYRFGWGCKVDKVAARVFYEVAANLGDPDALEEIAWCLMEGFGGPKDKLRAAQYYRLAECAGRKRVGESWIWKDKYNIPLPSS